MWYELDYFFGYIWNRFKDNQEIIAHEKTVDKCNKRIGFQINRIVHFKNCSRKYY